MLEKELLDILACPKCKGALQYDEENQRLICWACKLRYRIENDMPIMLVDGIQSDGFSQAPAETFE